MAGRDHGRAPVTQVLQRPSRRRPVPHCSQMIQTTLHVEYDRPFRILSSSLLQGHSRHLPRRVFIATALSVDCDTTPSKLALHLLSDAQKTSSLVTGAPLLRESFPVSPSTLSLLDSSASLVGPTHRYTFSVFPFPPRGPPITESPFICSSPLAPWPVLLSCPSPLYLGPPCRRGPAKRTDPSVRSASF